MCDEDNRECFVKFWKLIAFYFKNGLQDTIINKKSVKYIGEYENDSYVKDDSHVFNLLDYIEGMIKKIETFYADIKKNKKKTKIMQTSKLYYVA